MPVKDKVELGGAALSGAYAVDQLLEAYQNEKHHGEETTEHVAKAAVASAIAVGLFYASKQAHEQYESDEEHDHDHDHHHHSHHKGPQNYAFDQPKRRGTDGWTEEEESGHKKRILEEAVAAYALGRRLLGEKNHPIATVIAEGLGAIALLKEGKKHAMDD